MFVKSRALQIDHTLMRLAYSILPILTALPMMLLAATCAWASDTQPTPDTTGSPAPPAMPHMDVSDPPPFVLLHNPAFDELDAPLGASGCPAFLFRNGFESGLLTQAGGAGTAIRYITSGGYLLQINFHTISIQDPISRNKVEHWGDPHENLNGKHIKDWAGAAGWDGTRRTIVLGDGTKVTMEASGPQGVVELTSIYDAEQNVQINNTTNTILHHSVELADTQSREATQYDGEASEFTTNLITGVANYITTYNEDSSFQMVSFNQQLGISGGCANPNNVNDYFDDPRLGHT